MLQFLAFNKNELVSNVTCIIVRQKLSNLFRRSSSALPGKGLKDIFPFQMSPLTT
jgi:hypothetical protein